MVQGFIEITCFPYGQLPSVDVDKHHDQNYDNNAKIVIMLLFFTVFHYIFSHTSKKDFLVFHCCVF